MGKKSQSRKLSVRYRRWKRRYLRRHPERSALVSVMEGLLGFLLVIALAGVVWLLAYAANGPDRVAAPAPAPVVTAAPVATDAPEPALTAAPVPTDVPMPAPTEVPVPVLQDAPTVNPYAQSAQAGTEDSDPAKNGLIQSKVYADGSEIREYVRTAEIHMPSSDEYSALEGVTTFRGSHYRDGGAYGTIPESPSSMSVVWRKHIGKLDDWTGVGWTGQASAVRWPESMRQRMNIRSEKRNKDGLVEVIYATLDGHIYFLDLDDGEKTRDAIDIGAPIKGSLTVDPRGYPLLYCGQGIYDVKGKRVSCGTRVWSLLDQSMLFMLNGKDKLAQRPWQAFDCSPLVDGASDTLITAGENGVLYTVRLNTNFSDGAISIDPVVDRYVYLQSLKGKIGSENSVAVYNNYVYFANNSGIIQCVDLNTMKLVWSCRVYDDVDASLVLEVDEDGSVGLYGVNELDVRGHTGACQMFKINALTGELLWVQQSDLIYQNNENGGGGFATPALGKGELSNLAYFHIARTKDSNGMFYALDKQTGEKVWVCDMGSYGWSSPTCVYAPSGKGYVLVGSRNGKLRLFDGLSGKTVTSVELDGNIEGTPVVFDDMIVVGTRASYIYGIRIQ